MLFITSRAPLLTLLTVSTFLCVFSLSGCAKPSNVENQPRQENQTFVQHKPSNAPVDFDAMSDEEADAWLEADLSDDKISLTVANTQIRVEYADTLQKRQLGLMYRRDLCEDCGMLFKFDSPRIGSIWMKNTFIPLDLAYIDEQGTIIDIVQLQAHDLTPVKSSSIVLYALEMNKGWFAKQDIRVGDKVAMLP